MEAPGAGTSPREKSASTHTVWVATAGIAALGGILMLISALVPIASSSESGNQFSFSLWDFAVDSVTSDTVLDSAGPWFLGFGIYAVVLSGLIVAMTVRRAAPGLRRALAYTQGVGGIALFGLTVAVLRNDTWGLAGVSPAVLFSLLAFAGAILLVAGGMVGAVAGIAGSREPGTSLWLFGTVAGRMSRQGWWVAYVAFLALLYSTGYALTTLTVWLLIPWFFAAIYVAVCIDGKRWHDRGRSAWWFALYAIPVVGSIWVLIELGFLRGTPGSNSFGQTHADLEV